MLTSARLSFLSYARLTYCTGFDEDNPTESLQTAVAYGSKTLERLIADGLAEPA